MDYDRFEGTLVIDGWYRQQANWSRCTRFVAYEPGGGIPRAWERPRGRFTFEALHFAEILANGKEPDRSDVNGRTLYRWLVGGDAMDDRITKMPPNVGLMSSQIPKLIEAGRCRIHCIGCSRGIGRSDLTYVEPFRRFNYVTSEIRCLAGHLLIRPIVLRLILDPRSFNSREILARAFESSEADSPTTPEGPGDEG